MLATGERMGGNYSLMWELCPDRYGLPPYHYHDQDEQFYLIDGEITSDTVGYSDVIFGMFFLLGYQFSPRLVDIGEARFWRIDRNSDYGPLDEASAFTGRRSEPSSHRNAPLSTGGNVGG